ncbi:uncharacterized protein TM35_000681100, partial [Trypanosoma theileri]
MTKAVMVRCYLLCLLTLTLCCACGLVFADQTKPFINNGKQLVVCFPPSVPILLTNGSYKCGSCSELAEQDSKLCSGVLREEKKEMLEEHQMASDRRKNENAVHQVSR